METEHDLFVIRAGFLMLDSLAGWTHGTADTSSLPFSPLFALVEGAYGASTLRSSDR